MPNKIKYCQTTGLLKKKKENIDALIGCLDAIPKKFCVTSSKFSLVSVSYKTLQIVIV